MSPTRTYRQLRAEMTLSEKASLMSGANFWNTKPVERLGIPSIMLTDGPHGLRKQGGAADHLGLNASLPATCFPPASTLANSWDEQLLECVGAALGAEAAAEQVSVLLGPGLNIKRNPLAGRNFEYFSEDPLLSGRLAAGLIRGIQSQGVAACAKHFAVNSQETHRMSIDEIVDERALHEIYLEGFRIALAEGGAWTVMSSYNRVNGTYANEHRELLHGILRERWGFDGLVVTDWGGDNDRVAGIVAGNALEMPSTSGVTDLDIVRAVETGELDETVLDARVDELLGLIERTGSLRSSAADGPGSESGSGSASPAARDAMHAAHHELAVEAARRSLVLLENPEGILPLNVAAGVGAGRVAVIGDFAGRPRYQGAGSSLVNPTRIDAPLEALRESGLNVIGYEPGFSRRDARSAGRRRRALRLAERSELVLLFLGLDESAEAEGVDRQHMRLAKNQLDLVDGLIALEVPVVVVLAGGAPVELPFAGRVDAILHGYLAGQGGGRAIADVLLGRANPGGKLTESYPMRYEDVPSSVSFTRTEASSEHRESIYVGYRYFDKVELPVRYPFGHGLSYTDFAYSDLTAGPDEVTLTVANTGDRAGDEVVQLYIEAPDAAAAEFRAVRELRGFARVALAAGESRTVRIPYAEHAFETFDAQLGEWRTVPGRYTVQAAASSRDVRLQAEIDIAASGPDPASAATPAAPGPSEHYLSGHVERVDADDFAALLGRELPSPHWPVGRPLTRADLIAQTRGRGGFASLLHFTVHASGSVLMALGRPLAANNTRFVLELPFRSVSRMSGGKFDEAMLDGLLLMVNRRFFRGSRRLLSAWRAKRAAERSEQKGREK